MTVTHGINSIFKSIHEKLKAMLTGKAWGRYGGTTSHFDMQSLSLTGDRQGYQYAQVSRDKCFLSISKGDRKRKGWEQLRGQKRGR